MLSLLSDAHPATTMDHDEYISLLACTASVEKLVQPNIYKILKRIEMNGFGQVGNARSSCLTKI